MPFSTAHDPYYTDISTPAGWVRRRVEDLGVRIRVVDGLDRPGYCTPDGQTIVARPALEFPSFHWLVACGAIAKVFGLEWTPDLTIGVGLPLIPIPGGARILPFQKPGTRTGTWSN
jgi:hypothetical protein